MKCDYCGKEEVLPFKCQYCQGLFCAEHRLPENHACPEIEKARAPREEARPFEYKVTYTPPRPFAKFWFSSTEIKHLVVSAILVTGVGLSIMFSSRVINPLSLTPAVLATASFMFIGVFLFHEIAHKLVAQHFGLWAEFRLILFGAILTLISIIPFSFFKIIAPGAVMVAGAASRDVMGKTAVAGPLTNIALSVISLPIAYFLNNPIAYWSVAFNAWIALLNVLPIAMLDGLKIYKWNKIVWAFVFTLSLALTIATFIYI